MSLTSVIRPNTIDSDAIAALISRWTLDCYVDADFAGGFQKADPTNPNDCKSRTGFVIKYAGCPIVWSSKLQSTIALSTTEAEYMAMSMALREVIFMENLLSEMKQKGVRLVEQQSRVMIRVFEDNVGAIELAKLPKLRPRTKHIAIQYHHFRSWTSEDAQGNPPRIKVEHIRTSEQEADIMTMPLAIGSFEYLRKLLLGW